MAQLTSTGKTTLPGEEVIVRAVQFFTGERWRAQTQSQRTATFVGKPRIPWGLLFLTIIAFCAFIIPGVIMYILIIRRMYRFQNIVVAANPITSGTEVVITHPKAAKKLVARFVKVLPQ